MKQVQTYEQALDKVIDFWAEKSFNTMFNQNNGDNSSAGGLGFMLMNMLSQRGQEETSPQKIEVFKERLKEHILSNEREWYKWTLDVDYHAYGPLLDACKDAGLSDMCVPIKTVTWINRDTFEASASYQYGGAKQIL